MENKQYETEEMKEAKAKAKAKAKVFQILFDLFNLFQFFINKIKIKIK